MCQPVIHRALYSHTVKENAAQRSDAHSQPAHRFSGWKSPCAQRGQIWYHSTAGKGGSRGQYWYGRHFCLGKSLRECKQLLLIVWGHIQSQVLLVCVTGLELEWTWNSSFLLLSLLLLFYGTYHVPNVTSLGEEQLMFLYIFTQKVDRLNGGFHAITRKCEFKGCLHLWTCSSVPSRHKTCPLPNWLTFLDDCQETKTKRRLAARLQQRCWWEG